MNIYNLIHPRIAYEEAYAAAMLALAEKEGRTGSHWKDKPGPVDERERTKFASDETLQAVRLIVARPLTSQQLADLIGVGPYSVSNRLASLARAEVVKVVSKHREGKFQQLRNVWGPGPRVGEWLERMERNG